MLLTSVSLTMAVTPFLDEMGGKIAGKMEEGADFTHYMGQDDDALEITDTAKDSGFVVVVGYGVVGKVVCDLLDAKLFKYTVMEKDPKKAIGARNKGLPVFYGDIGRQEVAEAFSVDKAKAVIVAISDKAECTRAVIALRRMYPDKPIFARAKDADHAKRLQTTLDVAAMVPILPEDNLLLTLPFGGAVLRSLGAPAEEVNYILAEKRREVLSGQELSKFEEETVLAQLGVEEEDKKEEKTEVATVPDDDSGSTSEVDVEASLLDTEKEEEDCLVIPKKPVEDEKSLVQKVVDANLSPEKKARAEKETDAGSEEKGVCNGEPEKEIREKQVESTTSL